MISTFDIDDIMYQHLVNNGVLDKINGGVYRDGSRPVGSKREDVCINHVSLTMDSFPQSAYTNINIYVPDKVVKVDGTAMSVPDNAKLKSISNFIISILREKPISGVGVRVESETLLEEQGCGQHYVNLRILWNIQR